MGPSGSGKSTLLHCAAGIIVPDAGEVIFAGEAVGRLPDARAQRAAPHRVRLRLPVRPAGARAQLRARTSRCRYASAGTRVARRPAGRAEWLERLEVTDVARSCRARCPAARDSGSRWRAALVTEPRVVFADEPTGALDSLNGERVMQLLTVAARETEAAVVLVTHEARVAAYADREVIVRDGRTREI